MFSFPDARKAHNRLRWIGKTQKMAGTSGNCGSYRVHLPCALSPTQNEPKEPKGSQINPHLDHETAADILLEEAAYRCFDLARTNLAHLSPNRATHLKSPKNQTRCFSGHPNLSAFLFKGVSDSPENSCVFGVSLFVGGGGGGVLFNRMQQEDKPIVILNDDSTQHTYLEKERTRMEEEMTRMKSSPPEQQCSHSGSGGLSLCVSVPETTRLRSSIRTSSPLPSLQVAAKRSFFS